MLHNAPNQTYFLESWDFTAQSQNAENLIKGFEVSDNASPMVRMGKDIEAWHLTCNSHSGNLLAKDIVNLDIAKDASTVLNNFKHPDLEKEILEKGGVKIVLVGDTRWCTYRDHFVYFIRNLNPMRNIIAKGQFKVK